MDGTLFYRLFLFIFLLFSLFVCSFSLSLSLTHTHTHILALSCLLSHPLSLSRFFVPCMWMATEYTSTRSTHSVFRTRCWLYYVGIYAHIRAYFQETSQSYSPPIKVKSSISFLKLPFVTCTACDLLTAVPTRGLHSFALLPM